jgi:hypothetical protein
MFKCILITVCIVFAIGFNGRGQTEKVTVSREKLPALNVDILDFVDSSLGKKIDQGHSSNLYLHIRDQHHFIVSKKANFSKIKIDRTDIKPGDFFWTKEGHFGIVYKTIDDNSFYAATQGMAGATGVSIIKLDFNSYKFKFCPPKYDIAPLLIAQENYKTTIEVQDSCRARYQLGLSKNQAYEDISEDSKMVVDFIDEHLGEKIGNGICNEVYLTLRDAGGWWEGHWDKRKKIQINEIRAGDIFSIIPTFGTGHRGFVYAIIDENHFIAAHQNVGGHTGVVKTMYSISDRKFTFYRPEKK